MVIGSYERVCVVDVPFDNFGQKHPTGSCKIGRNIQKIAVFQDLSLYALELLTEGHRGLVIGSNERDWSVDVPFDHFGQIHPIGSCKISLNSQK